MELMNEIDALRSELRDARRNIEELRIAMYRESEITLLVVLAAALAILMLS